MRYKKFIYILLIVFIFSLSFMISIRYLINKDNSYMLNEILESNNPFTRNSNRRFAKLISFIVGIDFNKPLSFIKSNYSFNNASDDNKDIISLPKNNYVKDPKPNTKIKEPIIYIYNTHQSEQYSISNNGEYNIKPTVMTASYILREMLNKNGLNTIVEENDVLEFLKTNNWNYAASYKVTRILLEDIIEKEPTLKYFIDIHRDSVNKKISTVNINGKDYAKLLFIVGLENNNYDKNLELTEKLNNSLNSKYPNITRGIYKKKGPGVNGVYNQDFNPNTILIEVGGEENTIEEVYNSCIAISNILTDYIKGEIDES